MMSGTQPLPNATLKIVSYQVSNEARTATTDASGAFVITGVPAGPAHLEITAGGVKLLDRTIEIIAGKPLDISLAETADNSTSGLRLQVQQQATVTATLEKLQTDLTNDPAGMPTLSTTVTAEQIEHTNIGRDFNDVLNRVPGVVVGTLQQGDIGGGIKVRGFFRASHGAEVATYVDGMPQNLPASTIGAGFNDMSWLNPLLVEKIEVIKGPFSALYGNQNRAASINIVTKDAAETRASVTYGSFGFVDTSMIASHRFGPVQTLAAAQFTRQDGYRDHSDFIRGNVFAKATFRAGKGIWGIRSYYQGSNWNAPSFLLRSQLVSGAVKPTDRDPTVAPLFGDANRTNITLTRRPQQGENGLLLTLYGERYNRRRALGVTTTTTNIGQDQRWISGARAVWTSTLRDRLLLNYGGELRSDYGRGLTRQSVSGTATANYAQNQNLNLFQYAGLLQGQVKVLQSLKLSGGFRVDAFHYDIGNLKLPAASLVYDKAVVTPKVGLAWTPFEKLSTFFNMGQGFRSVEQTEISPIGAVGPLGASGGNAVSGVTPPKITSYDYGFKTQLTDRVSVSAAGFYTVNQSEIQQISAYVFAANGDATRIGWEAEGRVQATDSLSIYANLTDIVKSQLNNPTNGISSLLNVPQYVPKAGVAYAHPVHSGAVALNVDGFYYSGFPFYAGTPLTLQRSKPYSRFDLRGSYDVRRVELIGFVQLQPYRYSSEAMYSTAAGLFIDPPAKWNGGVTARYRF